MVELLGTYTSENASAAREDAQRCILAALADPNTFLLDPLLALKPVRFLEGELIHDLLLIFVQEKLPAYLEFHKDHKEFVESNLGLNHEQNMKKMRLLTFMQLAETNPEMSFQTIQNELQIEEDKVESFIIDGTFITYFLIFIITKPCYIFTHYDGEQISNFKKQGILKGLVLAW